MKEEIVFYQKRGGKLFLYYQLVVGKLCIIIQKKGKIQIIYNILILKKLKKKL